MDGLIALMFFTTTFSIFEKVKKEQFVLNNTNGKTKKIVLSLFNASPYPIALVNKEGHLTFCNEAFELMLR